MSLLLRRACTVLTLSGLLTAVIFGGCSEPPPSVSTLADIVARPLIPSGQESSEKAAVDGVELGALAIATVIISATAYGCYNAALEFLPDVTGFTQADAEEALLLAGFQVGQVYTTPSKTIPPGNVISQEPEGGKEVLTGIRINLLVSQGPDPQPVPDVTGQLQANAQATLEAAGFLVGAVTMVFSSTVPPGIVISQEPPGGTSLVPGTPIHLTVSQGEEQITVPDVLGMTEEEARAAIIGANLTSGTVTPRYSASVAPGTVISQNPEAGAVVGRDSAVNLVVSSGDQPVAVPDVVGRPQADAETLIAGAGFSLGAVTGEWSEVVPQDAVIRQHPDAGSLMTPGTAVDLVVSQGPEPSAVPDVLGKPQEAAESDIIAAGFLLGRVVPGYSETAPEGIVIGQTPAPGALMPPGTPVNLVISQGSQAVAVPDIVGETEEGAHALIIAAGFTTGTVTREWNSTAPAGTVISQTPGAGVTMPPGSPVSCVVSLGPQPIAVPDITGFTQSNAEAAILAAGFSLGLVTGRYHDTIAAGIVISQNPLPGVMLIPGSLVSLIVSQGAQPTSVPGVIGKTQAEALQLIVAAGFSQGTVTPAWSTTVPVGFVMAQDPAAGTLATPGAPVHLVVSQGPQPIPVPAVTGWSLNEAQSAITGAGLTVGTVRQEYSDTVPEGHVVNQNPPAGTLLLPGGSVNLMISTKVIATCEYYPLELGNTWVAGGDNGYRLEVAETLNVNGYTCWKMVGEKFGEQPVTTINYLVYVNGWIYSYEVFTDLYRLPELSPGARRLYPEYFTPGVFFPFTYNDMTFNVTPVLGRLSDFVTDWAQCPYGDVEDTIALKLGNLVVMVLGRNLGILWQFSDYPFTTSLTIMGGCGITP